MSLRKTLAVAVLATMALYQAPARAASDDIEELRNAELGARNEWHLVKNDAMRNIKTYSKQEDGKRVRTFRIEMVVEASMETVARVHYDADNLKKWFWETTDSRMLKKVSPYEFYYYQVFNAPVTMPDRDSIIHAVIQPYTARKGFMVITLKAAPDYMPPAKGLVRVTQQDMAIKLTPMGKDKTKLEVEGYIDPGGISPVWGINAIQRMAPYSSMLGLQRIVQQPMYREPTTPSPFIISAD
ncbi:START domain-containing protein [Fluviicoccus keumensis]|uniref:START domain-containing protein n=1 Tax=Fluviicoccus keumensis TaxID=1435465 RepID=A0A4Q7YK09_9GAMM|nr:START domain-containing protein [Fluviicoccus keumensis]RZU36819.1 START domain-containing protein [Fluviicoccus keumensis]